MRLAISHKHKSILLILRLKADVRYQETLFFSNNIYNEKLPDLTRIWNTDLVVVMGDIWS